MNKVSKKVVSLVVVFTSFFLWQGDSYSADYKSPHRLKAGDVISADVVNEVFDTIESSNRSVKATDILGSWTCIEATSQGGEVGYTLSNDGIVWVRSQILTFSDNLDGTYSWLSEKYDPFFPIVGGSATGNYSVVNNMIVATTTAFPSPRYSQIRLVGPTRFVLPAINSANLFSISCDKNNIAPENPTEQSLSVNNQEVTLTWLDGSSDETNFVIMRRDSIDGQYAEVGRVVANVTSYQETLVNSGTYWYRVKAINSNGHSYGSNVVKVVIP